MDAIPLFANESGGVAADVRVLLGLRAPANKPEPWGIPPRHPGADGVHRAPFSSLQMHRRTKGNFQRMRSRTHFTFREETMITTTLRHHLGFVAVAAALLPGALAGQQADGSNAP